MELHFEELLGKITDFIKTEAKTETVVGQQFDLGEFKCVPVIKVGMGFGSGGGEGTERKGSKGEGMGAGAGVGIEPIGFLVSKGDENILKICILSVYIFFTYFGIVLTYVRLIWLSPC